jgi:hypothetical protein
MITNLKNIAGMIRELRSRGSDERENDLARRGTEDVSGCRV